MGNTSISLTKNMEDVITFCEVLNLGFKGLEYGSIQVAN